MTPDARTDRPARVERDLLAGAQWRCAPTVAGGERPDGGWRPATVPGTAAGALRAAGDPGALVRDYDAEDWWFCASFDVPRTGTAGAYRLELDGVSTVADVIVDGVPVLHSENMFTAAGTRLELAPGPHELAVRCAALTPLLQARRPRPRWKSPDLVHQNLRWFRTSLVGRQRGGVQGPAPVGPWRPVRLVPDGPVEPVVTRLVTTWSPDGARLDLDVRLPDRLLRDPATPAEVEVAGHRVRLDLREDEEGTHGSTVAVLPDVERWSPHTHGQPRLHELTLHVGPTRIALGRVGFRTVEVDRTDGAFTLSVNGSRVFARGVCWTPLDPVTLTASRDELRRALRRLVDAGLDLVRVTGVGVYESPDFLDLCDELGLLLWQDCMFAFFDAPDTEAFRAQVEAELRDVLGGMRGRPCLAVVCGGSENEQQAQYLGLPPDRWVAPLAADLVPALVDELVPGTVYVRSTPGESSLPSRVDQGPGHYFGVGAYLAPLEDARRARVRFAAECLSFANPAEPLDTVEGQRVAQGLGHAPEWKAGVHRDATTTWDLEDVRDWYTRTLFDVDPLTLRRVDGERAHLLARATVAAVFEATLTEWRRPGSSCAGAVVLQAHDAVLGGGLGIVDGLGRPKSSWYVLRRLMTPHLVTWTDEGVNGMALHLVSDDLEPWPARVRLEALVDGRVVVDTTELDLVVTGGGVTVDTSTVFGGFRDLSHAHRFGPPAYDVVVATLLDAGGRELSRAVHLPGQRLRPVERDLGLRAVVEPGEQAARVTVSAERFAQWVSFDLAGWYARDAWFHVLPGRPVTVDLVPTSEPTPLPRGTVTAVNAARPVSLEAAS